MLVTDFQLRTLTRNLEELLPQNGIKCIVYDKIRPNPTVSNVEEALQIYKENNCKGLIAFGGGSSMDCAKAVGARVACPRKPLSKMKGILKIRRKIPFLAAIPTTAGTGSEVTVTAVITDEKTNYKYTMSDFPLIPKVAVLDPKVTFTLPKSLTASTGVDALTHAVEAYIGRSTIIKTRNYSRTATKLIFENIEKAYQNGYDEEARRNMLMASQLAVAAGLADKNDSAELAAKNFIRQIEELNARLDIPETLKGIKAEDIPELAKRADKEANPIYPVPVLWNARELEQFYYAVMEKNEADKKSDKNN